LPEGAESGDFISNFLSGFKQGEQSLASFAENSKKFGTQIRQNLQAGIANGAANAFAAFGSALASGENGLKAFADAAIKAVGQVAIQLGKQLFFRALLSCLTH